MKTLRSLGKLSGEVQRLTGSGRVGQLGAAFGFYAGVGRTYTTEVSLDQEVWDDPSDNDKTTREQALPTAAGLDTAEVEPVSCVPRHAAHQPAGDMVHDERERSHRRLER